MAQSVTLSRCPAAVAQRCKCTLVCVKIAAPRLQRPAAKPPRLPLNGCAPPAHHHHHDHPGDQPGNLRDGFARREPLCSWGIKSASATYTKLLDATARKYGKSLATAPPGSNPPPAQRGHGPGQRHLQQRHAPVGAGLARSTTRSPMWCGTSCAITDTAAITPGACRP